MTPIVKVDMYTAACDGCGADLVDQATGREYSGYSDVSTVLDLVDGCGGGHLARVDEIVTVACEACLSAYMSGVDGFDTIDRGHGRALTTFLAARRASAEGRS